MPDQTSFDPLDIWLRAPEVRRRCGGVTSMTLWRWQRDPELGFPQPRYINNVRYFSQRELEAWVASRPLGRDAEDIVRTQEAAAT